MKFKRKFTLLAILVILLVSLMYFLPHHAGLIAKYDTYIFYPFQSARLLVLGFIPFSIGDVLYVVSGIWLLVTLARCIYYLVKFAAFKDRLAASVLRSINTVLFVYLIFILGWGANYYKPFLKQYWALDTEIKHRRDASSIIAFDRFLVDKLNTYAPHYHSLSYHDINERAKTYYRTYTDSKVKEHGLDVKPTLFGYFMERMAVQGYYNPFTGEGQVNSKLPSFMLPFVVSHEMAHQAGIAAEGDANLMAYAVGTISNDSSFRYSCYLNIWMYTNSILFYHDSLMANKFQSALNPLTLAQMDTLDEISRKYHNGLTRYTTGLYDGYLRMQHQKEGIRSYGNVATVAWQLELQRKKGHAGTINIP